MADYKLYYFPGKGRAEAIRLLFAYKGIKYEDIRIPGDKWPENKPNMPFGMMPVMEENGKKLGGSVVILRYLAEKFGCAGSNAWENAWLANIADFIVDLGSEMAKMYYEKDEEQKKVLQEKLIKETIPNYFGKLNEMAAETGYLCCGKLTWPDLQLFNLIDLLITNMPNLDILANYPGLAKLKTNIESDPNIAKWLAERPKTQ